VGFIVECKEIRSALTKLLIPAENFPFCTIKPNEIFNGKTIGKQSYHNQAIVSMEEESDSAVEILSMRKE
ncbi:hypothetical protein M8C21_003602, partial [Ambrosia artemisiifolia]